MSQAFTWPEPFDLDDPNNTNTLSAPLVPVRESVGVKSWLLREAFNFTGLGLTWYITTEEPTVPPKVIPEFIDLSSNLKETENLDASLSGTWKAARYAAAACTCSGGEERGSLADLCRHLGHRKGPEGA